ncbi:MAG: ABC transporter permease subunit [Thermomicrobiales bacterium]|nr:ABC transporter permease subunit [Thermomicrobiales bacterium]
MAVNDDVLRVEQRPAEMPPHWRLRFHPGLLVIPALLLIGLVFAWPLVRLMWRSFSEAEQPLANFQRILTTPLYLGALGRTFGYAALATLGSLVLGYPLAYRMRISRPAVRTAIILLVVIPFFVALLVRTFGWMIILGRTGPISRLSEVLTGQPTTLLYTPLAVQIGMVAILLPFMVLPLYSVMASIDLRLLRAARVLGASPAAAFLTVFLPLTLPGILAGIVLVFMLGIGFFVTPDLLGSNRGQVFATLIVKAQSTFSGSSGFVEAMAIVLLIVTIITLMISSRVAPLQQVWGGNLGEQGATRRRQAEVEHLPGRQSVTGPRIVRSLADVALWPAIRALDKLPNRLVALPAWLLAGLAIVLLDTPILVAIAISFGEDIFLSFPPTELTLRWYQEFAQTRSWIDALVTSVGVGLLTAVFTVIVGGMAAIGLVRAEYPGKDVLISLLVGPMIIPQVITGIAIYYVFFPLGLVGSVPGLVLAHSLVALPIVTITMAANLRNFDVRLERTARVLGASPLQAFRHVTLPIISPGIVVAAFFAFLTSFDELVFSLFLVGVRLRTLPIRLWEDLHFKLSPMLAVVSVIEIVLVLVAVGVAGIVTRSRRTVD